MENSSANSAYPYPQGDGIAYAAIADGKTWYAPTKDEWEYLLGLGETKRENASNLCKQRTVNDVLGLVILPDGCTEDINNTDWSVLEKAGAVFLPAAGCEGDEGYGNGYYSSSTWTHENSNYFYIVRWPATNGLITCGGWYKNHHSVRLVRSL